MKREEPLIQHSQPPKSLKAHRVRLAKQGRHPDLHSEAVVSNNSALFVAPAGALSNAVVHSGFKLANAPWVSGVAHVAVWNSSTNASSSANVRVGRPATPVLGLPSICSNNGVVPATRPPKLRKASQVVVPQFSVVSDDVPVSSGQGLILRHRSLQRPVDPATPGGNAPQQMKQIADSSVCFQREDADLATGDDAIPLQQEPNCVRQGHTPSGCSASGALLLIPATTHSDIPADPLLAASPGSTKHAEAQECCSGQLIVAPTCSQGQEQVAPAERRGQLATGMIGAAMQLQQHNMVHRERTAASGTLARLIYAVGSAETYIVFNDQGAALVPGVELAVLETAGVACTAREIGDAIDSKSTKTDSKKNLHLKRWTASRVQQFKKLEQSNAKKRATTTSSHLSVDDGIAVPNEHAALDIAVIQPPSHVTKRDRGLSTSSTSNEGAPVAVVSADDVSLQRTTNDLPQLSAYDSLERQANAAKRLRGSEALLTSNIDDAAAAADAVPQCIRDELPVRNAESAGRPARTVRSERDGNETVSTARRMHCVAVVKEASVVQQARQSRVVSNTTRGDTTMSTPAPSVGMLMQLFPKCVESMMSTGADLVRFLTAGELWRNSGPHWSCIPKLVSRTTKKPAAGHWLGFRCRDERGKIDISLVSDDDDDDPGVLRQATVPLAHQSVPRAALNVIETALLESIRRYQAIGVEFPVPTDDTVTVEDAVSRDIEYYSVTLIADAAWRIMDAATENKRVYGAMPSRSIDRRQRLVVALVQTDHIDKMTKYGVYLDGTVVTAAMRFGNLHWGNSQQHGEDASIASSIALSQAFLRYGESDFSPLMYDAAEQFDGESPSDSISRRTAANITTFPKGSDAILETLTLSIPMHHEDHFSLFVVALLPLLVLQLQLLDLRQRQLNGWLSVWSTHRPVTHNDINAAVQALMSYQEAHGIRADCVQWCSFALVDSIGVGTPYHQGTALALASRLRTFLPQYWALRYNNGVHIGCENAGCNTDFALSVVQAPLFFVSSPKQPPSSNACATYVMMAYFHVFDLLRPMAPFAGNCAAAMLTVSGWNDNFGPSVYNIMHANNVRKHVHDFLKAATNDISVCVTASYRCYNASTNWRSNNNTAWSMKRRTGGRVAVSIAVARNKLTRGSSRPKASTLLVTASDASHDAELVWLQGPLTAPSETGIAAGFDDTVSSSAARATSTSGMLTLIVPAGHTAGTKALQRNRGAMNCWSNSMAHILASIPGMEDIVLLCSATSSTAALRMLASPLLRLIQASTGQIDPLSGRACQQLAQDLAVALNMDQPTLNVQRDWSDVLMRVFAGLHLTSSTEQGNIAETVAHRMEQVFGSERGTTKETMKYTVAHGKIWDDIPNEKKGTRKTGDLCTEGKDENVAEDGVWSMLLSCKTVLDYRTPPAAIGGTHFRARTSPRNAANAVADDVTVSAVTPLGDLLSAAMIFDTQRADAANNADCCKYCGVTTSFISYTTMTAPPPVLIVTILRSCSRKVAIPFELEVLNAGRVDAVYRLVSAVLRRGVIEAPVVDDEVSDRAEGHFYVLLLPTELHSSCRIIDDGKIIDVGDPHDALVHCAPADSAEPEYDVQSQTTACVYFRVSIM